MEKLGIDIWLLSFQIFNFSVIIILLNKLVFKPLSKKMAERTKLIEKGLGKEQEAIEKLADIEIEKSKMIESTKKEIDSMMLEAAGRAELIRTESLENTRKETEALIKKTKEQLAGDREEMVLRAKEDLVELTIEAVKSVLGDDDSGAVKEKLNKKAIEKLWQKDKTQS